MARTIPAGWTQSTGCLPSGDLWGWQVENDPVADVLGGPTVTSSCYPPDYEPNPAIIYATDKCPEAFTEACSTQTNGNWWSICCPTAYQFRCDKSKVLDTGTLFCGTPYASDATSEWVTFSYTKFGPYLQSMATYQATINAEDQGTRTKTVVTASGPILASDLRGPGAILWAMAVLITSTSSSSQYATTAATVTSGATMATATADTSQVTSSLTSSRAPASTGALQSSGVSTGAAVGIGVGAAAAAALLVGLGGWLLYRRRLARGRHVPGRTPQESDKRTTGHVDPAAESAAVGPLSTTQVYSHQQQPYHGYDYEAHHRPQEMDMAPPRPRELE